MKTLTVEDLRYLPARMEYLPLYVKEVEDGTIRIYVYNHAAISTGCVKINDLCNPMPYKGDYGVGFTVELHNSDSTRFCLKAYYIEASHGAVCAATDNCTFCPLYSADGTNEECLY